MVQKNRGLFIDTVIDTEILSDYVQKRGYIYIKDRPALDHLMYEDYRSRKKISMTDEKIQCPFALAKTPFLKRRRAFAYPTDSKWHLLFDREYINYIILTNISI